MAVGDATAFLDAVALDHAASVLENTSIRTALNANEVGIAAIGMPMALFGFSGGYLTYQVGLWSRHLRYSTWWERPSCSPVISTGLSSSSGMEQS